MGSTNEPTGLARRDLIKRAAVMGAVAVPASGLLSACASSGSGPAKKATGDKTASNPLGVDKSAPLDVLIFNGGFGDDYAKQFEKLYGKEFSGAKVSHNATQNITGLLQPRLNAGNPPDVVDDSGNQMVKLDVLKKAGQLSDLTPLLDAPSIDDPSKKVRDMLMPGTEKLGTVNGTFSSLPYVYTVFGMWYSGKLFKKHGWTAPTTWADFLSLSAEIKKAGVAPFAWQGKYPYYIDVAIMDLAIKNGGPDFLERLDQMDPDVWDEDAPKHAIEAVHEIVTKKFLLPGTNGMTHIESQTAWNQYKAAFIPCGAWLENEQLKNTPSDFDMAFMPMPSLPGDKMPAQAIRGGANEFFIVPKQAKNQAGGMEFMRLMLSKKGATAFAQSANSLTVVKDGVDPSVQLRPGTQSTVTALKSAGNNIFNPTYLNDYSAFSTDMDNASGEVMAGRMSPADWLKKMKASAVKAKKGS